MRSSPRANASAKGSVRLLRATLTWWRWVAVDTRGTDAALDEAHRQRPRQLRYDRLKAGSGAGKRET